MRQYAAPQAKLRDDDNKTSGLRASGGPHDFKRLLIETVKMHVDGPIQDHYDNQAPPLCDQQHGDLIVDLHWEMAHQRFTARPPATAGR